MRSLEMYVLITANASLVAKKLYFKILSKVEMFVFGGVKHRH